MRTLRFAALPGLAVSLTLTLAGDGSGIPTSFQPAGNGPRVWGQAIAAPIRVVPPEPASPPFVVNGPVFSRPYYSVGIWPIQIVADELNGDGIKDLLVLNRGAANGGGFTGGNLSFLWGKGDGSFQQNPMVLSGGSPFKAAVGRFNNDTINDVAIANFNSSQLQVFLAHVLGNGLNGYATTPIQLAAAPTALLTADFNHDGRDDLAVALGSLNRVVVLLGSATGVLAGGQSATDVGNGPASLATGDFDEDGILDLAVADSAAGTGDLLLLRGLGDGTFAPATSLLSGGAVSFVASGDFDADGHLDLTAAAADGTTSVAGLAFLRGRGAAGFAAPVSLVPQVPAPLELSARDLDTDGVLDIALRWSAFEEVGWVEHDALLAHDGQGGFRSLPAPEFTFSPPSVVEYSDLNGDGNADVVASTFVQGGHFEEQLEIQFGAGKGGFVRERCIASEPIADLTGVDLNHDGRLDLLALEAALDPDPNPNRGGRLRRFIDAGGGRFTEGAATVLTGSPFAMRAADFNGDGLIDVAVAKAVFNGPGVEVLLGRPDGTFVQSAELNPTSSGVLDITVGDFDGNGRKDLAALMSCGDVNCDQSRVAVYQGLGDGTFIGPSYGAYSSSYLSQQDAPRMLASADFDRDGADEILLVTISRAALYRGLDLVPAGSVDARVHAEIVDYNDDGFLDILSFTKITLGRGDGTFLPGTQAPIYQGAVIAADFDGDGAKDLVSNFAGPGFFFTSTLVVRSDGHGGYREPATLHFLFGRVKGLVRLDFDADGRPDIAFGGQGLCLAADIGGNPDRDADSIPDALDPCTDTDGDGFADHLTAASQCALDNCPAVANPAQTDSDGDGLGNACDACPFDAGNDADGDGVCAGDDLCPLLADPGQADSDGDGAGDACDNCPNVASSDFTDSNGDGAGDVCQPALLLSSIREDGGTELEVDAAADDPQGQPLHTEVRLFGPPPISSLGNLLNAADYCAADSLFGERPGEGLVYVKEGDLTLLTDLDFGAGCNDSAQDFMVEFGSCDHLVKPFSYSSTSVYLMSVRLPVQVCVARYPSVDGFATLTIFEVNDQGMKYSLESEEQVLSFSSPDGLPASVPMPTLTTGAPYRLSLRVTDGNTPPIGVSRTFVGHGESLLVIDQDVDDDGLNDARDGCIDPDHDGRGVPGVAPPTCPVDNCPLTANPDGADADGDGIGDACDPCTDTDGDNYGDPGFPGSICPLDVCPGVADSQVDLDADGLGDACDPCTDPDGDGFGNASDARQCPLDNCPDYANPDQTDLDADGLGDSCDSCNDIDHDGTDDVGGIKSCPIDNCPGLPNPYQEDTDHDGLGDACDTCNDPDSDGFGIPGSPGQTCPDDNCPFRQNFDQLDADADGAGDACDTCTDTDQDGLGDPGHVSNVCRDDNCPTIPNPGQSDRDTDGLGDACDACPNDVANDADHDGVCESLDNCPTIANAGQENSDTDRLGDTCDNCPALDNEGQADSDFDHVGDLCDNCPAFPNTSQADVDHDGYGDLCDNCPRATNANQADSNGDGSGDACQPTLTLGTVVPDGHGNLRLPGNASDPQGETLSGELRVLAFDQGTVTLPDIGASLDCGQGLLLDGVPGEGIGYAYGSTGIPYLFDLDSGIGCNEGDAEYMLAFGTCAAPGPFTTLLDLSGMVAPFQVCARHIDQFSGGSDIDVLDYAPDQIHLRTGALTLVYTQAFSNGVPLSIPLATLRPGKDHRLEMQLTDGNTRIVKASTTFSYNGEALLFFDFGSAPKAVATAAPVVECTGPDGGAVTFDGSGSTDADSTPGTQDGIAAYDWLEDFGQAGERLLGSGAVLTTTLPLGGHAVTLRVTDQTGKIDTTVLTVTVQDTTGPALQCPAVATAECTGAGGAYVGGLTATAADLCGGTVTIVNDQVANGGADASGPYALGTTSVGFLATDARGNTATCSAGATVRDTQPPTLRVLTSPASLWPANHDLVPIEVTLAAQDVCMGNNVRVELLSATSSEADDSGGFQDGATNGDIQGADLGTADGSLLLRAERDGKGPGRVYTLTYRASDTSGNATTALGVVTVPHDQGQGPEPLLLRLEALAAGTTAQRIFWPALNDAIGYDVIRGTLSQVRRANGVTNLGPVAVLARNTALTTVSEPLTTTVPPVGDAFFYLVQERTAERGATGWGSEPAPWPRQPESCEGGCPSVTEGTAAGGGDRPVRR
jgi:hypothetical protein